MELIEIVDENGDFTGQVMDKEEAHDKNLLHNEVGIFIINDDGKVGLYDAFQFLRQVILR